LKSLIQNIYIIVVVAVLFTSCNPTKVLAPGEVYLKANVIGIPGKIIEQDVLYPYLKQRDNKRALWIFKIKMVRYLAYSDSTINFKNEKKRKRITHKNEKRLLAGKDSVEFKPHWTFKIKEGGEPPVVFDSTLAKETITQFKKALFNRGYFNNEVSTFFKYNRDSSKVSVIYSTTEGIQYNLNKIALVIDDNSLLPAIKKANEFSLLHTGDPYNTDKIDEERLRFTGEMRNQGYYYFSKEFIAYEVDSALQNKAVNIKVIIKNPPNSNNSADSLNSVSHQKYKIGTITLNTSFNSKFTDNPADSIHFDHLIFINLSRLKYNPHTFTNKLFYQSGDFYSQKAESRTYTRLSGLNNFKYINIGFAKSALDSNTLNCNILMSPFPTQSIGVEMEGTNTSGNLGVSGYLNYLHRNTFGNAEEFKVRFKGGVEAQQTNTVEEDATNGALDVFNTKEFGVETSLTFQDLILTHGLKARILKRFNRPKTSLNFIINYQNRPDFERFLTNASIGYTFTQKKENTHQFFIHPVDISFIRVEKTIDFEKRLEELNNPLLNSTYDNQFIAGSKIVETWTNKKTTKQRSFMLNRALFEIAGNVLNAANKMLGSEYAVDTTNTQDYYTIGQVRYAQFVKAQNDFHFNTRINRTQSMAYRVLAGIGIPYGNAETLPYDRSFYGGGANDMRGWQARSLGPGGLLDDSLKAGVDQVADIKIQLGAEYRFNISKSIEGAIFADAGNIWLLRKDDARPLAEFDINRFYKEIALSLGSGVRFNFGFLLVRLDWGVKIFDPALPEKQRFVLDRGDYLKNYGENTGGKSYQHSVFNLGIGYPF
jgi:outer membrane protein assembly factor BamA